MSHAEYDLAIIGGGINGCGIARDAAGRGLKVFLAERDDLAGHTSSWSSKLIHGGLRYLENYQFRLVRESLQEREVIARIAPHLTRPLAFVLPHDASMRPAWMIRAGLFLYDRLGGPTTLPVSRAVTFPDARFGEALAPRFSRGFVYSDLQVDDARLTIANAVSARELGATVQTRTTAVRAQRVDGRWEVTLTPTPDPEATAFGQRQVIYAKALVNAAGPWAKVTRDQVLREPASASIRLVRGSHLVVPKLQATEHAYLMQQPDGRIVFLLPYQDHFTLIGTTDSAVDSPEAGEVASDGEIDYLLAAANRYLAKPVSRRDILRAFAGVRPLYDDGQAVASKVTRDYVLKLDSVAGVAGVAGAAPVLHVYGGKLTTYRRLAEHALAKLAPFFVGLKGDWTATRPLPGGESDSLTDDLEQLKLRLPEVTPTILEALFRRHGSRALHVLGEVKTTQDLGRQFGQGLTEREIEYMVTHEWALTAEDVLTRRSKAGWGMGESDRAAVKALVAALRARRAIAGWS
jgi:glycerol-3-phosphate dehydrogenase